MDDSSRFCNTGNKFHIQAQDTDVKIHLWKTMGLPSLLYVAEAVAVDNSIIKEFKSVQSLAQSIIMELVLDHITHICNRQLVCNLCKMLMGVVFIQENV